MTSLFFDYIIIGAGLAGLSLAMELCKKEPKKSILLVEARKTYIADRTWCFWNTHHNAFDNLVEHSWHRWIVRHDSQTVFCTSQEYRYSCIPSLRFYNEATSTLSHYKNVVFWMDTTVLDIQDEVGCAYVQTTKGQAKCKIVYDSRPNHIFGKDSFLIQHFVGWEIETDNPVFNPEEVVLMDFDVDQQNGLHFMYLLPYSPTKALIESTRISNKVLQKAIYEADICNYLKNRYDLTSYRVCYKEQGSLPMHITTTKPKSSSHVLIGTKAGWMRASTGYAFLPIQQGIKKLLYATKNSNVIDNYLDSIMLKYMQHHPQEVPGLFLTLFNNNPPERLVRFLSGTWNVKDLFGVILNMPKRDMIREVFR